MSDGVGIYEQLLPHWIEFCKARRSIVSERGGNKRIFSREWDIASRRWLEAVWSVCGPDATLEWPDDTRDGSVFFEDQLIDGPCIVCGCIIFNDTLQRLEW